MAKKNVLQNFVKNSITIQESDNLKGGRSNNPINTGSFGFINWDDIEVREPGVVTAVSIQRNKVRRLG